MPAVKEELTLKKKISKQLRGIFNRESIYHSSVKILPTMRRFFYIYLLTVEERGNGGEVLTIKLISVPKFKKQ